MVVVDQFRDGVDATDRVAMLDALDTARAEIRRPHLRHRRVSAYDLTKRELEAHWDILRDALADTPEHQPRPDLGPEL